MPEPSRLATTEHLQKKVRLLIERFSELTKSIQDRIVVPLSRGEPPQANTVEDISAAIADYHAVAAEASKLGLGDKEALALPELLTRLTHAIESESWDAIRAECRPEAELSLRIVHKTGHSPPFLQELH